MRRFHLFEIEDMEWLPNIFREMQTDGISFAITQMKLYDPIIHLICRLLKHMQTNKIVDLCAGAGGPWFDIYPKVANTTENLSVTCTDKFPSATAEARVAKLAGDVYYLMEPIDATDVPKNLQGIRTIFAGLHHFQPHLAKSILQTAVNDQSAIAVFEFTERKLFRIIWDLLFAPVFVLLTAPFIKPFRLLRLLFIYIVPITLFIGVWDGFVSNIRTYSQADLRSLTDDIDSPNYKWEIGRVHSSGVMWITYLLGYPVDDAEELSDD